MVSSSEFEDEWMKDFDSPVHDDSEDFEKKSKRYHELRKQEIAEARAKARKNAKRGIRLTHYIKDRKFDPASGWTASLARAKDDIRKERQKKAAMRRKKALTQRWRDRHREGGEERHEAGQLVSLGGRRRRRRTRRRKMKKIKRRRKKSRRIRKRGTRRRR